MAIVENTLQSIYDQLLYLSGQNSKSVKIEDAVRLFNYALNDYTHLALSSDGRWKAADRLSNGLNIYTTALNGSAQYTLQADFLRLDRVEYETSDGKWVVDPVDRKDHQDFPLSKVYNNGDRPLVYDLDGQTITLYPNPGSGTLRIYPSLPFGHFENTTLTQEVGIPPHHMEFLVLHALHRLTLRTNDQNRAQVRDELEMVTRKVRDDYDKRDEDTPRKLKAKVNVIE